MSDNRRVTGPCLAQMWVGLIAHAPRVGRRISMRDAVGWRQGKEGREGGRRWRDGLTATRYQF